MLYCHKELIIQCKIIHRLNCDDPITIWGANNENFTMGRCRYLFINQTETVNLAVTLSCEQSAIKVFLNEKGWFDATNFHRSVFYVAREALPYSRKFNNLKLLQGVNVWPTL